MTLPVPVSVSTLPTRAAVMPAAARRQRPPASPPTCALVVIVARLAAVVVPQVVSVMIVALSDRHRHAIFDEGLRHVHYLRCLRRSGRAPGRWWRPPSPVVAVLDQLVPSLTCTLDDAVDGRGVPLVLMNVIPPSSGW